MPSSNSTDSKLCDRVRQLNWKDLCESLWSKGFAMTPAILTQSECNKIAALFWQDDLFRSVTDMAKKRFGSGVYKYFKYPLPENVTELRTSLYEFLAPIANEFNEVMGMSDRFPAIHSDFLQLCHEFGQKRPTPLLLHYEQGDFNCLHQDIYGDIAFPLQATIFLSDKDKDYEGGEFLISEQLPRAQARIHALKPEQGQIILFTTRLRPEKGARGYRKTNVKHGVATINSGKRDTLGIIFHDAK